MARSVFILSFQPPKLDEQVLGYKLGLSLPARRIDSSEPRQSAGACKDLCLLHLEWSGWATTRVPAHLFFVPDNETQA